MLGKWMKPNAKSLLGYPRSGSTISSTPSVIGLGRPGSRLRTGRTCSATDLGV